MKKKNKDLVHQQFQNKLRKKYKFRIIVFVISVFISILFIPYNTVSPALWGVLLGIGGSGLTWALFEFFDLSLNVYEEYSREFYDYFSNVNDHWTKIKKAFKTIKNPSGIDWPNVKKDLYDLYNMSSSFPFHGPAFSISQEFEDAHNYIARLYWKTESCCSQKKFETLYNAFVITSSDTLTNDDVITQNLSRAKFNALADIPVNFDEFHMDDNTIILDNIGDLSQSIGINANEFNVLSRTFKPGNDFIKHFHHYTPSKAVFKTVIKLICRTVSSGETDSP